MFHGRTVYHGRLSWFFGMCNNKVLGDTPMKPTKTFAKLFSSVSTLAGVADAMALNVVDWGDKGEILQGDAGEANQCDVPAAALR